MHVVVLTSIHHYNNNCGVSMIKKSTLNHRHKLYQPLTTTVLHLQHRNYLPFKREGKNTRLLAWYFRIDHTDHHALFPSNIYKIFLTKEISCASQNLHWDHSDTGRVEHVRCNLLIRNDNHSYTHSGIDGGASGSSLDSVSYPETLKHPEPQLPHWHQNYFNGGVVRMKRGVL